MKDIHGNLKKKFPNPRLALLTTAITLILCSIIGGTLAWLVADTDPVVNTFTYGDINITLTETDTNLDGDNDPNTNKYPMVPGKAIQKDPKVTVKAESEDAWLFVKVEKSANFDTFMTFEVAEGWNAMTSVEGVYYRSVNKADTATEIPVLKDNTVQVRSEVTKEMLNALDANGAQNYPTLTLTAYAVQRDSNIATAADAWAQVAANTAP